MLITIDDSKTIGDIQDRFSLCFPSLKIEFYDTPHKWKESSSDEHLIDAATLIKDIRKTHQSGVLEIKSWFKTGDIEQFFRKQFGLNVQIFRLEEGKWKQSTKSDPSTLAMQSEIAMRQIS
jgi:hypothetical protein